jgi:uncharacterized protein (DUF2147 family)
MVQICELPGYFPSFFFSVFCQSLKEQMPISYKQNVIMSRILVFLSLICASFTVPKPVLAPADDVVGIWLNSNGTGKIQVFRENGKYFGKIVWLREPLNEKGQPKKDAMNPSASLRQQPLVGSIILRDFVFEDGEWTNGQIYDPENGKDYKCYLRLKDANTLLLRGYIGISLIGRTEIWKRSQL